MNYTYEPYFYCYFHLLILQENFATNLLQQFFNSDMQTDTCYSSSSLILEFSLEPFPK